ncbi:hypothetical protein HN935_04080 [archaeon]|jgi:hypothetical protein|nr:hypothetical protein [archaeon]
MENVKNNTASWRDSHDWIWRVVILVVVILFIVGFYFLLSWDSLFRGHSSSKIRRATSDSPDEEIWADGIGSSGNSDAVVPAPPVLPS